MRRLAMATTLLVLLVNPPDDHFNQLTRNGSIEENAPVKASAEITINASPEKVWALLTDVNAWPKWQQDITQAAMDGPLENGASFSWAAGTTIRSRIALVQPQEKLAWTGTAYGAKAIHIWTLQRLPGNRTLVRTNESMDGFLLTLFYSSSKLEESDRRWLKFLKVAAER